MISKNTKANFLSKGLIIFATIILSVNVMQAQNKNLYDFKVKSIDGSDYDLSQHKGKKVLIVNTASKCGLTPQYKELEELYKKYGSEKFVIIGFPANDFLWQEPGTNEEIKQFCQKNYGVSFPMMEKISVKGKDIHPLYEWLTKKENNKVEDADVSWNFQKFMIDENGNYVGYVAPKQSPMSEKIIKWLENK